MFQGFLSTHALLGVHFEQSLEEAESLGTNPAEILLLDPVEVLDFWKFHAEEALVFEESLIVIGSEGAETLLDEEELVELILSGEHWVAVDEFSKNATDCPHVDFLAVGCSHQQLRGTVPARGHVIG